MQKKKEDNKKKKEDEYDYRQMKSLAYAYFNVVKLCNNNPSIEQLCWTHPLLVPIVTNAAFSCELFIKSLLQKEDNLKCGHNLKDLFDFLSDEVKLEIIGNKDKTQFYRDLNDISDYFEQWRYIYERYLTSLNLKFLIEFMEKLSLISEKFV